LFTKIRNDFGKTSEEERKIEQLRTIKQEERTYDWRVVGKSSEAG